MPRTSTPQRLTHCFAAAVFLAVTCMITMNYLRSKGVQEIPVKSMAYWQVADIPLGFPLPLTGKTPPFDPRFIQLTAFERATIPTATRMTESMDPGHGTLAYNAQPYGMTNTQCDGHHTTDGMSADLGDPVYAIANGLVIYRGKPSPGRGKTLILAHRTSGGQILLSMYAHLEQNFPPLGDLIHIGESIGTTNLGYPARLHWEIRDSTGIHIGKNYASHFRKSPNAEKTIRSRHNPNQDCLHLSPFALLLSEKLLRQTRELIIKYKTSVTK